MNRDLNFNFEVGAREHLNPSAELRSGESFSNDLRGEIVRIVRGNFAPKPLNQALSAYHERDIALALPELEREEKLRLMRSLPEKTLAAVLEYDPEADADFALLSLRQRIDALNCMDAATAAELLQRLPRDEKNALLELLEPDARHEIGLICSFDEDEIGSRMSTNFIAISENSTVKEAMSQLIQQAAENDNISMLYLVDESGAFCGGLDLKDLIIAREGVALDEIATPSYPYLYARTPVEECVPYLREYSEASIPVLDEKNRLIGVVTAQDLVEILGDEMNEDYARLGGLSAQEDLCESVAQSVKKRMPWLCILLALGLGVSAAVGAFESVVARLPIIMCFQSLILDMAGNVGTQSLAVAIRVLMDRQLERGRKAELVWKEARVGLINGGLLGLLSFAAIGAYLFLKGNPLPFSFAVSACLGVAMVLAMLISALSGTLIPLFFKRVGVDPAVASGPLITTVNDLVAVVAYYGLAWLILIQGMGLG